MDYNRRRRTPEILHCPHQLHLINDSGGISKKGLTHEQNPLALICVPVVCLSFQPCTSSHLSSSPWVLSCSTLSQHTQFYPKSLLKHLMTPRLKAPQTSCCCLQTMTLREPRHSQPTIHHDWRMTSFFSPTVGQWIKASFTLFTSILLQKLSFYALSQRLPVCAQFKIDEERLRGQKTVWLHSLLAKLPVCTRLSE